MYSFAQRPDTLVVDEPLYGHYLRVSGLQHPGRAEILASMDTDGDVVMRAFTTASQGREYCFLKQMTHHLLELDESFLTQCENILLIRDPAAFITSYAKVIPHPTLADTGIRQQWELYQKLSAAGKVAAVIDARQLLLNPQKVLSELCLRLGMPFFKEMLRWTAGPRPEDGIWAPYWYSKVHQSTGFEPYRPREIEVPGYLQGLVQEANSFYHSLYQHALKA